jgi:hypothetical protein
VFRVRYELSLYICIYIYISVCSTWFSDCVETAGETETTQQNSQGRVIAQAVSRWLPIASGQHVAFVVDKAVLGQVFSEYFCFPCQSFHQFLHHHNHLGLVQ